MLKWNNVIKKFTIYHHHNPLLLGVLLFLENAFLDPTRDTTAASEMHRKYSKQANFCSFLEQHLKVYKVSQEDSNMCAKILPKLVTYCLKLLHVSYKAEFDDILYFVEQQYCDSLSDFLLILKFFNLKNFEQNWISPFFLPIFGQFLLKKFKDKA